MKTTCISRRLAALTTPMLNSLAWAVAMASSGVHAQSPSHLGEVVVTGTRLPTQPLGSTLVGKDALISGRAATSDTAQLLQDVPGVSLYGAGGVSSLPVIHGLADDRLRIQVDGMDLMAACPNHMNSPLSYIDPSRVGSISVFAGITPVSVGGDSIGGTIQVQSAPPEFANSADARLTQGEAGTFYRSNGRVWGFNMGATYTSQNIHIGYRTSSAQSSNYLAGGDFKAAGPGTSGGPWLAGNEVGSSAYTAKNQDIALAVRNDGHLLQLNVGSQRLPFEGFPNQRMDMTGNDSTQANLRYSGTFAWGSLQARTFGQDTEHFMNMGPDRFSYGTLGMPMNTRAKTRGALAQADIAWSDRTTVRVGAEALAYSLYDWWPQAGGVMGPRTFWNMDYGTRDRAGLFAEWEALWDTPWRTQLGLRHETVSTNTGPVQGYNAQALWASDAAAFNALDRARTDHNLDFTALMRYVPHASASFDAGFSRKSHSPNLYQRYAWSTQPMASLMNNFVGDGNGYVGNIDLKPEVAHTLSVSTDWHDAGQTVWGVQAKGYITEVQDFVDAQRCNFGQCGGTGNLRASSGFVNLQYVNQSARLVGFDLSGQAHLGATADSGSFKATGTLNYVRGENRSTGDNLYNIMPLNAKLAVMQTWGDWTNTAEMQLVAAKTDVSRVRNEIPTAGYGLVHWRSSVQWQQTRLDIGVENLFNRHYTPPLGGAYLGQGASMTSTGIPWGSTVPGMGRSIHLALSTRF